MKIVIPGGTGQVGALLGRALRARGHSGWWSSAEARHRMERRFAGTADGRRLGRRAHGADVVVNLAGRSANCRYTAANLKAMMDSRVDSTRAVGLAIAQEQAAQRLATDEHRDDYAHRSDAPNDERAGLIRGGRTRRAQVLGQEHRHRKGMGTDEGGGEHPTHAKSPSAAPWA